MTSKRKQAGMLSLDMAIALMVLAILVTLATLWIVRQADAQDYRIAADQQRTVAEAQVKYLKDNFKAVLNATATTPAQITVAMLRNTNYLPSGFSDTNAFGQTIIGLARRSPPDQLEAIVVTTGGQTIPEIGIRSIAEHLGGPGGFISSTNPNVIQGIRGGWQVALSDYGINPGAGHTASALFLMDGLASDQLYRNEVPNHPELNIMNTDLGMGGHNIDGAGAITASGNVTTSSDISARNITATGTITSTGRISTDEYLQLGGVAEEGTACSPDGLIGRTTAGLTLSCQSGVWVDSSKLNLVMRVREFVTPAWSDYVGVVDVYCEPNEVAVSGGVACDSPHYHNGTRPIFNGALSGWRGSCGRLPGVYGDFPGRTVVLCRKQN
ncbi:shufflon system plasmid conjugative transfer pilus tip adhesin PilV [Azotobacter vinelandii]|uniref:shufflon system plasmid conjugative transfer pilus tip adhesin PilV n=1 Tax=Azotobacter vinelandii TaxID=354 RepID=UPI0039F4F1CF